MLLRTTYPLLVVATIKEIIKGRPKSKGRTLLGCPISFRNITQVMKGKFRVERGFYNPWCLRSVFRAEDKVTYLI